MHNDVVKGNILQPPHKHESQNVVSFINLSKRKSSQEALHAWESSSLDFIEAGHQ